MWSMWNQSLVQDTLDSVMTLTLYPETFAVCQLSKKSSLPEWAQSGRFFSISKTEDELSVVCETALVPEGTKGDLDWRAFKLHGPFAFDEIGVVASLTVPLAKAKIGVFVISTYDTDYLLVKEANLQKTLRVLKGNRHEVLELKEKN